MKGFKESEINKIDKKQKLKNNNSSLFKNALNLQKQGELNKAAKIYHQLIKNKFLEESIFKLRINLPTSK